MRIRPEIIEVLEIARDIIRDEYSEKDFEERRYETFMITKAISIAVHEVTNGTEPERDEIQQILDILESSDKDRSREVDLRTDAPRVLSNSIRAGKYDPESNHYKSVHLFLIDCARRAVEHYNPKYLKNRNP